MTTDREHEFTLVLTGVNELADPVVDALFEAGCDDAVLGVRYGAMFLSFTRAAPTLLDAILSAITDVRRAGIGADVLRVDECDLVSQADIARRIKLTRATVCQYVSGKRGPGGFPPPACHLTDVAESALWQWCEVADWLSQNNLIRADELKHARDVAIVNNALSHAQMRKREAVLTDEVYQRISCLPCSR